MVAVWQAGVLGGGLWPGPRGSGEGVWARWRVTRGSPTIKAGSAVSCATWAAASGGYKLAAMGFLMRCCLMAYVLGNGQSSAGGDGGLLFSSGQGSSGFDLRVVHRDTGVLFSFPFATCGVVLDCATSCFLDR